MVESFGISFVLALVATLYMGDASTLLQENNGIIRTFPTWFVWAINPAAVTLCSFQLSVALQAVTEFTEARKREGERNFRPMFKRIVTGIFSMLWNAKERFSREPCLVATQGLWLTQAIPNWFYFKGDYGYPLAFSFEAVTPASATHRLAITDNIVVLMFMNAILAIGLAAKALIFLWPRFGCVSTAVEVGCSSGENESRDRHGGNNHNSRVPSLLVGWGIGYWATSLFYIFGCAWQGGGCGWEHPPIVVTSVGYVVVPCFLLAGASMMVDTNVLGTRLGASVKPAVDVLTNTGRAEHWIMATVLRDILIVWIGWCGSLKSPLDYYI